MTPLIEITSVPIEIRMKTTRASLEYTRGTAEMEISRSNKGVDIKSRPIRLQLDTFEPRSVAAPIATQPVAQAAQVSPQAVQAMQGQTPGLQAGYEATSAYSDQGQIMLSARFAQEPTQQQAAAQQNAPEREAEASESGNEADWENGELEIRYGMDKLNFDWKIDQGEFEFTPGDIELIVEQRPEVIIKYTGGPIYVPRSADPNYEPVDVKA